MRMRNGSARRKIKLTLMASQTKNPLEGIDPEQIGIKKTLSITSEFRIMSPKSSTPTQLNSKSRTTKAPLGSVKPTTKRIKGTNKTLAPDPEAEEIEQKGTPMVIIHPSTSFFM
jgi:hypothetical protein